MQQLFMESSVKITHEVIYFYFTFIWLNVLKTNPGEPKICFQNGRKLGGNPNGTLFELRLERVTAICYFILHLLLSKQRKKHLKKCQSKVEKSAQHEQMYLEKQQTIEMMKKRRSLLSPDPGPKT